MDENEFIRRMKENGFETEELLLMQHDMALKTLCAILAQKGILPKEWDLIMAAERQKTVQQLELIKENGVPWSNIKDDLGS